MGLMYFIIGLLLLFVLCCFIVAITPEETLRKLLMPPSDQTRATIRRISDETIGDMRRTSSAFRDHIDRETHDYRR